MDEHPVRRLRRERKLNLETVAEAAGVSVSQMSRIETGKRQARADELAALAEFFGVSVGSLYAVEEHQPEKVQVRSAPVVGVVQAGLWYDASIPPQVDDEPIPYVPTRFQMHDQFAYRVAGPSMNLKGINEGDYILVVPYWHVRTSPQDGDLAVIERSRDNGETERTVKEIVVEKDVIKLTPRSSDPAYRDPIVIPRDLNSDGYETVEIVALVIGAYRSFF